MNELQPLPDGHCIRAMQASDLDAVFRLELSSQPSPWSRAQFAAELKNPVSEVTLYCCDGDVAGYLCTWLVAGELQIHNVVTSPAYRRQGVAFRLLHSLLQGNERSAVELAWLEVREGNLAAIELYQKLGFRATDRRKRYYSDGEDALIMTLAMD